MNDLGVMDRLIKKIKPSLDGNLPVAEPDEVNLQIEDRRGAREWIHGI